MNSRCSELLLGQPVPILTLASTAADQWSDFSPGSFNSHPTPPPPQPPPPSHTPPPLTHTLLPSPIRESVAPPPPPALLVPEQHLRTAASNPFSLALNEGTLHITFSPAKSEAGRLAGSPNHRSGRASSCEPWAQEFNLTQSIRSSSSSNLSNDQVLSQSEQVQRLLRQVQSLREELRESKLEEQKWKEEALKMRKFAVSSQCAYGDTDVLIRASASELRAA